MAGQGKGVLRIAIEDFFTTTKIGKWIAQWFKDFGEDQEQAVYDLYKDLPDQLLTWSEDITQAIPHPSGTGGKSKQGGIAGALGFAGQIGMSAASSFMAPVMRIINYSMDKKIRSARLDPGLLTTLFFRNPEGASKFASDLEEQGWTTPRLSAYAEALQPLLLFNEIDEMLHRKIITDEQAIKLIMKIGYNDDQAQKLIKIGDHIPGISDLVHFADRFAWDDDIARRFQYDTLYPDVVQDWVEKLGYDRDWFIKYWRSHWELPSLQTVFELFHRLRPGRVETTFTADDLQAYLKTTPIPPYFHQRLTEISYNPYTRVDVRRMYKAGVIGEDEVYQTYRDLGYDDSHAKALKDFTIQWATGEDTSLSDKQANLTESLLADMFNKGIINESQFRAELAKLKYPPEYITWLVAYTISKRKADTAPDEYSTYQSKMKTAILAAYTARQITTAEATSALATAGYTSQAISWLLQAADYDYQQGERNGVLDLIHTAYTTKIMDRSKAVSELGRLNVAGAEQTQLLAAWDYETIYRTKRLSESDYTNALKLGIISQDKYIEDLQGLGLSDEDITVKLALYQAAQTAAQADVAAQQQKAEQTAAKKLSVTDLLDAYAKGSISEDTLYSRLQTAGFTTDDVSLLISTKFNAPAPTQSKLTVAQIMTALKRGALSVNDVTIMLTARGYTAEDIDILLASQATGA